jgi:hypothetical protein
MKKRVIDLSADELESMAAAAWSAAADAAFAKGLPVTGSRDGRRVRYYPDGRMEDLGPVSPLPRKDQQATDKKPSRKSVA